jgi:hypothetical protein
MAGMNTLEPKAACLRLPAEERLAGDEGDRPAAAHDLGRAPARRGDELDARHQHAPRVLLAKEDRAAGEIHERGAERTGEPSALRAHEVDVRLAVDLRAAEEEDIDASLPGKVEELARAFAERIAAAPMQPRNAQAGILLFLQQCACGRYRRSRADGNMARLADETRYYAGKEFFALDQTNSSR